MMITITIRMMTGGPRRLNDDLPILILILIVIVIIIEPPEERVLGLGLRL